MVRTVPPAVVGIDFAFWGLFCSASVVRHQFAVKSLARVRLFNDVAP
jgi:hypothetical protein